MGYKSPIRSLFAAEATLDAWYLVGSAAITLVLDILNVDSGLLERATVTVPTEAVPLSTLLGGKLNSAQWAQIVSISGGSLYGLPLKSARAGVALTTSTGWLLSASDKIGPAAPKGSFIAAKTPTTVDLATGAGVLALGLRNDGAAYATQGAANGDPTEIAVDLQGFVRTALEALTISITPTIATGAILATEVLFDLTALANAVRVNGGYTYLTGITVFDSDNEKAQLDFIFTQANTTALASGGVNNAPDISDANLIVDRVIGRATVGAGTYLSVTPAGNAVAAETFRPILMKAGSATTSIYVACTVPNAQNFTANNDLVIDFHFLRA